MPPGPDRDVSVPAILRRVRARLADLPGPEAALAATTIARVQPPNWTLEWQLPWWLGASFGLSAATRREIVVSNVLGLAAVRLQDDLVDRELPDRDRVTASRLAPILIERASAIYRDWFPPEAPFWRDLQLDLADWRRSMAATSTPRREPPPLDALASRAAPLLIGARAVTVLAGHASDWPPIERCLRHGVAALALLDDVTDWERDLDAGRWNAFVALAGGDVQTPARLEANHRTVLASLLTQGAAGRTLELVGDEAAAAAALARRLGCPPLSEHFASVATQARDLAVRADRHYQDVVDQMTQAFLAGRSTAQHAVAGGLG